MLSGSGDSLTSGTGGPPPATPARKFLAYALGALGVAGAVFLLWRWERAPSVWKEVRYERKRTRELPEPDETMEEVVWERRR